MKTISVLILSACAALLTACQVTVLPKPLLQKTVVLAYDDFGPETLAAPWLGPRQPGAQVVLHYGQPESRLRARYPQGDHRFVTVRAAVYHVGRILRALPADSPDRARVRATNAVVWSLERDRRTALTASPPFAGRGSMRRTLSIY